MKRSLIGLLVASLWLVVGAAAARAKNALNGFNPDAGNPIRQQKGACRRT